MQVPEISLKLMIFMPVLWVFKRLTISPHWNELESSAWSQNDSLSEGFTHLKRNNLILLLQMSQIIYVWSQREKGNFRFTRDLPTCLWKPLAISSIYSNLVHQYQAKSERQVIPHSIKATRTSELLASNSIHILIVIIYYQSAGITLYLVQYVSILNSQ